MLLSGGPNKNQQSVNKFIFIGLHPGILDLYHQIKVLAPRLYFMTANIASVHQILIKMENVIRFIGIHTQKICLLLML